MPERTVGRISTRAGFSELRRAGARGASGPVRVSFVPPETGATKLFPQVGYAVGRRCGGAVVRNRLRRRAREVVRVEAATLPRGSYLVRLEPGAVGLARADLRADIARALRRAARRSEARP